MEKTRTIIDAHTHIYPHKIAKRAVQMVEEYYGLDVERERPSRSLIESGQKIGVSRYLVCSVATRQEQVEAVNTFIAGECAEHREFLGFATLHPAMERKRMEAEVERVVELGLRGVKLHSDFQEFYIDDPAALPMYRLCAKHRLPILFHMGDEHLDYSAPIRLRNLLRQVDGLTAIAAHLGGYLHWAEAKEYLAGMDNVYYDTSSSSFVLSREEVVETIECFGTDRVFFGTDFPMWEHVGELDWFLSLGFSETVQEAILHGNFERLFGID